MVFFGAHIPINGDFFTRLTGFARLTGFSIMRRLEKNPKDF
jgi:hypothetical protein